MSDVTVQGGQEVVGVSRIEGPIVVVEGGVNVSYDEVVEIQDSKGLLRRGRVLEVGVGYAVVQIFSGSTGLYIDGTRVRFWRHLYSAAEEMLGRHLRRLGQP
jgi:V/A-type H+-transporting ATPase subunit B